MSTVFIFHGYGASPDANWFPWLKEQLEKEGHKVFIPEFPDSDHPNLDKWINYFKQYKKYLDKDTIIVAHSLGPSFALSVIEQLDKPIKAAFFISGFLGLSNPDFETIVSRNFDWKKIKQNCKKFYVYNSDNDHHVPLKNGEALAKKLGTKMTTIHGEGHIMGEHTNLQLPWLLKDMKKELSN